MTIILAASGRPSLVDFGLTRAEAVEPLTRSTDFVGTLVYSSPEQASGSPSALGPQSDVFSLGSVLFELLTLRRAFGASTPAEVYEALLRGEVPRARDFNPLVPIELETICSKAMERDLFRRYSSAAAFRDDLLRFLAGEPISARPASAFRRLLFSIRRNPAPWAAACLALIALSIGERLRRTDAAAIRAEKSLSAVRNEFDLARRESSEFITKERGLRHYANAQRELSEGRLRDAERNFTSAIEHSTSLPESHLGRARTRLLLVTGLGSILADVDAAERLVGPSRESSAVRSEALTAAGKTESALAADRAALQRDRADTSAAVRLAENLLKAGEFAEAEKAAAAAGPAFRARAVSAEVLLRTHRPEEAARVFAKLVKAAPTDTALRVSYAEALTSSGDLRGGEQQFRRCLDLKPEDGKFLLGLASNLLAQGRLVEALDGFKRSLPATGDRKSTYEAISGILESLNRGDEARVYREKGAELTPLPQ